MCLTKLFKKMVGPDPNPTKDLPKQFHERTGHILPVHKNPIQAEVNKLKAYAIDNKMVINEAKTKLMLFNSAKKIDILQYIELTEGNPIAMVDEAKLLGLVIRSDFKWQSNKDSIIIKSYIRMFIIRNLKRYGAEEQELLDTYIQQIRSIAEMACHVWNSGLTQQDERGLERIQRTALAIIRGEKHTTYQEALDHFGIEKLLVRREALCLKFAVKAYKNPKFSKWLAPNISEVYTRSSKLPLKEIRFRTKIFQNSPLPYLTRLLNQHLSKNKTQLNFPFRR